MAWTPKFSFTVTWDNISGKPATATRWPSWGEVTGKPATFAPSAHTHSIANITGLQVALDGKADDGSVVKTSGNQSDLSGSKTWTGLHRHTNQVHYYVGNVGTQQAIDGYGWSDQVWRWRHVLQPSGAFAFFCYNESGGGATNALQISTTVAGGVDDITFRGNSIWHAGNFNPSDYAVLDSINYFTRPQAIRAASNVGRALLFQTSSGDTISEIRVNSTTAGGSLFLAASNDSVYLRPNGIATSTGQVSVAADGKVTASGDIYSSGTVASGNALLRGGSSAAIFSFEGTTTGSTIYFRPRGTSSSTNQTTIDWNGTLTVGGDSVCGRSFADSFRANSGYADLAAGGTGGGVRLMPNGYTTTNMTDIDGSGNMTVRGNVSATGTVSDSTGDVRKLRFVTRNAGTTLAAAHLNGVVEKSNNTSYIYTIPTGLGSQGDAITFVNSGTSGNLTISRATGVALYRNGTNANIVVSPGSMVTIYRSATANRWIA